MITTGIFEKQAEHRQTLLTLIEWVETLFSRIEHPKIQEVGELRKKILNENLHVVVLGSFKRGKSTFINALLGEEILPSYATPCTAVINEVKWGETKKAVVHFRTPSTKVSLKKVSFASLPTKAKEHLKRSGRIRLDPLEIGIDELEDYVVIKETEDDSLESINDLPYDHVEIFWPLPLLKNGVVIIDSPGLDECESRTKITERYLTKADAILFVQSCVALAGQSEMDVVENLLIANGYEDVLFICNRFDEIKEKEQQRVKDYAREKLGAKTNLGEDGVFFLSASDALEGRLQKEETRVNKSGIVELERRLYTMLVQSRGKTKLIQPIRFLSHELADLIDRIHTKRTELREKVQDLQYRLKEYRRLLEREVVQMHKTLTKLQDDLLEVVQSTKATIEKNFVNQLYPTIAQEYDAYQPTAIGMSYVFSEKEVWRKRVHEIAGQIKWNLASIFRRIQKEMDKWLQTDFTYPNEAADGCISHSIERIVDSVDRLQTVLEGDESASDQTVFDVGTLKLDKLPKLSDAKVFAPAKHKQQSVSKALQSVGIDEKNLLGRSRSSFFSIALVDYFQVIDEPDVERLLRLSTFPYYDSSKNTNDLKYAIWGFFHDRVDTNSLLEPHTRFWDSSVAPFVETLQQRIDQRLEQLNQKAVELGQELSALQETLSASESSLKEIHSTRTSLGDLTYDLAML